MEPAKEIPPVTGGPENVTTYRGPELIRKLKEVRGVAHFSGHKQSASRDFIQKMASSVSKISESSENDGGMDEEQKKKMIVFGVVFVVLIFAVMQI